MALTVFDLIFDQVLISVELNLFLCVCVCGNEKERVIENCM